MIAPINVFARALYVDQLTQCSTVILPLTLSFLLPGPKEGITHQNTMTLIFYQDAPSGWKDGFLSTFPAPASFLLIPFDFAICAKEVQWPARARLSKPLGFKSMHDREESSRHFDLIELEKRDPAVLPSSSATGNALHWPGRPRWAARGSSFAAQFRIRTAQAASCFFC